MSNKKDLSFLKDKTLGIISSYQDNCGNATYTKQIIHDLKNYFKKTDCIELDQRMVHSSFHNEMKIKVINQAKKYDYINIQFEPALFHKKVRKAIKFIEEIIDARNGENISITFHSLGISQEIANLSSIQKKLFRLKLSMFKKKRKSIDAYKDMQSMIIQRVKKLQQKGKNISIIVHQKELSEKLSLLNVPSYFHPIVSANSADVIKFSNENIREITLDKYQLDKNITYIGNCFPHNFADAGDDQRGMMVLDWGQAPEYIAWPNQPLYRVMRLSEAIDRGADILKPNMHVRVELDIDISYEEANFIKDTFVKDHNLREMSLIPVKSTAVDADMAPGEVKFESVDQIVTDQLTNIESEFYDPKLLLKIYQNL